MVYFRILLRGGGGGQMSSAKILGGACVYYKEEQANFLGGGGGGANQSLGGTKAPLPPDINPGRCPVYNGVPFQGVLIRGVPL